MSEPTPSPHPYPHFMLKEVYEQPQAVARLLAAHCTGEGNFRLYGFALDDAALRAVERVHIVAWGASRHAGLVGRYFVERLARIPVEVDHAGEYRYREPLTGPEVLTVGITQSGETPDTMASLKLARSRASRAIAICNVAGSAITRECDALLLTEAGAEISVAATKSFTTQLVSLFLLALHLGRVRGTLSTAEAATWRAALETVPAAIEQAIGAAPAAEAAARAYATDSNFFFFGRGIHFPIALEGALKMKETSYVHAEGYSADEARHGPNALLGEAPLVVVSLATVDTQDEASVQAFERTLASLAEARRLGSPVVAVANAGDARVQADHVLPVQAVPELLLPMVEIVPLQLLAYHVAVLRGRDVDRPRNLAKFVTNE